MTDKELIKYLQDENKRLLTIIKLLATQRVVINQTINNADNINAGTCESIGNK